MRAEPNSRDGVSRHPDPAETPRVIVEPAAISYLLRVATSGPLRAPLPADDATAIGHPLPDALAIDPEVWVAWCIAGLHVAARLKLGQVPDDEHDSWLEVVGDAAKRALTILVMRRAGGNITHAAESLRTSRGALRKRLHRHGLHPWPRRS